MKLITIKFYLFFHNTQPQHTCYLKFMEHTDFILRYTLMLLFWTSQNCIEINILSNWTKEVINNQSKNKDKKNKNKNELADW